MPSRGQLATEVLRTATVKRVGSGVLLAGRKPMNRVGEWSVRAVG